MHRIGVDVGGTNTDAALLENATSDKAKVLATAKVPSTTDVTTGVQSALRTLLEKSKADTSRIQCITIGTTYFINALVGRDASKLRKVAVIRLASNGFTELAPPFVDFPPDLAELICGHVGFVSGGLNIDGSEIGSIDRAEVLEQCRILKEKGLRDVVIVGPFSPLDNKFHQEQRVSDIINSEIRGVRVVCSAQVGRLGILERESSAILNACLLVTARYFIASLHSSLATLGLGHRPLFLSCNDGTMVGLQEALDFPVKLVTSGPSNSMIGASFISQLESKGLDEDISTDEQDGVIIIDVGGSTTDAGVLLRNGFPRQASAYSRVAGVQVNFAMPDVESIGLGGGSVVRTEGELGDRTAISVGPDSVGHRLTSQALSFDGDVITATDIAIAAGETPNFGTREFSLEPSLVRSAKRLMQQKLEDLIDSVKTKAEPLPVVGAGGGAFLLGTRLRGTSSVTSQGDLTPVANAIGAAIARLSSTIDRICPVEHGRSAANDSALLELVTEEAKQECIVKGADTSTLQVITKDILSLPYIVEKVRVVVQVTGQLDPDKIPKESHTSEEIPKGEEGEEKVKFHSATTRIAPPPLEVAKYRPRVSDRQWFLSETDLEWLANGCYILGCGGGGNPHATLLQAREALRRGHTMRIADAADLPPSCILLPTGEMGSPMVSMDRPGSNLVKDSLANMISYQGIKDLVGLVCFEIGGMNGINHLMEGSSAAYNVPLVDGDLMGRAFPTLEMISLNAAGSARVDELMPISLASGDGTNLIMQGCKNVDSVDRILRASCVEMSCAAGVTLRPMTAREMTTSAILRSHSLAWRLGRAVKKFQTEQSTESIADSLIREFGGLGSAKQIFEGKIVATDNRLIKGHSYGSITVEGLTTDSSEENDRGIMESLKITFKNENLLAEVNASDSTEPKILATVPDLIMVLDSRTGQALGCPEYRYGLKVIVLAATSHPIWTTPRGLDVSGPEAFGLKGVEYRPVGRYEAPRSVIDEFE